MHQELAASGAVRAVLPCFIGDRDARLARDGAIVESAGQDLWLVINKDFSGSARVRAVADFLTNLIQDNTTALAGESPQSVGDQSSTAENG
ncbi:MAG: hypothetical protein AAGL24_13835 [Pseudomonadota bacterium]